MAPRKKIEENKPVDQSSMSFLEKRQAALASIRLAIKEKAGDCAIRTCSYKPMTRISTGVLSLDLAIGGGWPIGRVHLLAGKKSCGKSTVTLLTVADAQKRSCITNKYLFEETDPANQVPYKAVYIDAEGSFDSTWAQELGVDLEAMEIVTPGLGEELVDVTQALVASKAYDIIILDSLASLSPKAEYESSAFDQQQGVAARLVNKMFRKIQTTMNIMSRESPDAKLPTVLFINQLRQKTGVVYGSPDTLPGGLAQEFCTSIMVMFSGNTVTYFDPKDKTMPRFTDIDFFVTKNKTAAPKVSGGFCLSLVEDNDDGYRKGEVIEHKFALKIAETLGVIEKNPDKDNEWFVLGEKFNKRGDIVEKYVNDPNMFLLFKREICAKRHPKQ